jgi:hypothetical protein
VLACEAACSERERLLVALPDQLPLAVSRTSTVSTCFASMPCMSRTASVRAGIPAGSIAYSPASASKIGPRAFRITSKSFSFAFQCLAAFL